MISKTSLSTLGIPRSEVPENGFRERGLYRNADFLFFLTAPMQWKAKRIFESNHLEIKRIIEAVFEVFIDVSKSSISLVM